MTEDEVIKDIKKNPEEWAHLFMKMKSDYDESIQVMNMLQKENENLISLLEEVDQVEYVTVH